MCSGKIDRFVSKSLTPDYKSEKITKIRARLTKLSPKQFSLSIFGMSVFSNISNLTR